MKLRLTACALLCSVLGLAPLTGGMITPAAAQDSPDTVVSGSGTLKKFQFVTQNSCATTSSWNDVLMPDMSRSVTIQKAGPMLIHFTARMGGNVQSVFRFVAQVDGVDVPPGEIVMEEATDPWGRADGFTWVVPNVTAGSHTVRIMWSSPEEKVIQVCARTLTVFYNK